MLGKKSIISVATSVACLVVLTACGGSGHSKSPVAVTSPTPPTSTPTPIPSTIPVVTTKVQVIDAYAIGKKARGCVTISDAIESEGTSFGAKGTVIFKTTSKLQKDSIFNVAKGCVNIDADNDGKDNDSKKLAFEMAAPFGAKFITPLTTWLVEGGEVDKKLYAEILNFNPVEAPTIIAKGEGREGTTEQEKRDSILAYNLLILSEILKASEAIDAGSLEFIAKLDLTETKITSTNLATDLVSKGKIVNLMTVLDLLPKMTLTKVDVNSLLVNLTDGEKSLKEALALSIIGESKDNTDIKSLLAHVGIENENISNGLIENGLTDPLVFPTPTPIPTPIPIPAKINLMGAKADFGDVLSVELDVNNHFVAEVVSGTEVAAFYNLDLSSVSMDKAFDWSPASLIITILDGADSLKIEVQDAEVKNENDVLSTKLTTGTEIKVTDTRGGATKMYTKTNKKERIQVGLSANLGDLLDENDQKEKDTLDLLQTYLDSTGKTFNYSMKVTSDAFEPIEVTGDIKTQ